MKRRKKPMSTFKFGAISIVVIVIVTYLGFTKGTIPFIPQYEIKAQFQTVNTLKAGSPVRIAGVEAGEVTAVEPLRPGAEAALVTMKLYKNGRPLHTDAQAQLRPRIFLEGNFVVELRPGTPSAPTMDKGDTIPINQTSTPVQLDQVLKTFPKETRANLRGIFAELFRGYSTGFGKFFNRSLRYQAPAAKYSAIVSEALLGRRSGDLSSFIRNFSGVAEGLDRNPEQLKSLLTDFNTTFAAFARRQNDLQAAVAELPRTLTVAQPAFDSLNRAFPPTRRFAAAARPAVRSSGPAIDDLRPFVAQLRGLVQPEELRGLSADLRQATPPLARLARVSVPFLRETREFSSCQNEVILPWSRDRVGDAKFPATGPVFEEFAKVLPNLNGESRSFDANGPWFKVLGGGGVETLQLGENTFGTAINPIIGNNPPKSNRPPVRPDVPCETQEPPDLRSIAKGPPQPVNTQASSPAAQARYAKAREVAIQLLRDQLKRQGSKLPVSDKDITPAQIEALGGGR